MEIVWVAVGGAIGSAMRYGVNVLSPRVVGGEFPMHTMIVNIAGCFAMGAIVSLAAHRLSLSNELRLFLTTGILGGFTTFSAFALDFAVLVERRDFALGAIYLLASVILSLLAVFAGLAVVRQLYS